MTNNIAVIGCGGAIGGALLKRLAALNPDAEIHGFARQLPKTTIPSVLYHTIDYDDESAIEEAATMASRNTPLDKVIIATGMLHQGNVMPEKSLRDLSAEKLQLLFKVNTIVPALIAKHFLPILNRENRAVFAALSARVGSISDNNLGGWYSYRASKAALNMIIKNAAIETARRNKNSVVVGLHPGSVDTQLSAPFHANIDPSKIFSPDFAAEKLLDVLSMLTPEQSGKCFGWDGQEILP